MWYEYAAFGDTRDIRLNNYRTPITEEAWISQTFWVCIDHIHRMEDLTILVCFAISLLDILVYVPYLTHRIMLWGQTTVSICSVDDAYRLDCGSYRAMPPCLGTQTDRCQNMPCRLRACMSQPLHIVEENCHLMLWLKHAIWSMVSINPMTKTAIHRNKQDPILGS